ncbi:hypothetical protein [Paenibacillus alvei]|uniref:Uncharacterized protein n=1 Tax=Paenibacillus alvei TaxID=44250 RepID=A0AAP7DJY1_PAEAL|nr:hypothetical protein [Paenibacillus alvei]
MDKIGIMGHSFGGATAFNVLNLNGRVRLLLIWMVHL